MKLMSDRSDTRYFTLTRRTALHLFVFMNRLVLFALILVVSALTDIFSKNIVEANFELMRPTNIIGDYLRFTPVYNTGSVFGGFQGNPRIFHVLQGIGIVLLAVYFWKSGIKDKITTSGFSLLLGGAIGNFTDKFFRKGVFDFIDMGIGHFRWFVYNLADVYIFLGIVILLMYYLKKETNSSKQQSV